MDLPVALSIAGSDPCSGAGLQRDLKSFHDFGVYGISVTTLLTAQNNQGVKAVQPVPSDFVRKQLETLQADFTISATKISIVYNHAIIQVLLKAINDKSLGKIVIDPVLSASSGYPFFIESDFKRLIELLTQAELVTPNIPEAALLLDISHKEIMIDPEQAIAGLHQLGIKKILLKGGHAEVKKNGQITDYFSDGRKVYPLSHQHIDSNRCTNFHGTGCILGSAITACLAQGCDLLSAITQAKTYLLKVLKRFM